MTIDTRCAASDTSRRASASSGDINSRSASRIMSAPSMISPAWLSSVARARASCGFWCAMAIRSCTMARLSLRSSLASTSAARRCSFSIVARRASPNASRPITTASASVVTNARARPTKPRLLAARKQILDQMHDTEADAEQRQAGEARPEQRAPGKAAPRREHGFDRHRQRRRIVLRGDLDGGAAEPS